MEKTDHPYQQDPQSERQQCICGKALIHHQPKVMKVQGTAKPTKTGSNQ